MTIPHPASSKEKIGTAVRESVFFIGYFLYIWLCVEPALIYQRQNPVFLTGFGFLREFHLVPGGQLEYASAFLSQGFYHSFLGAVIIAAAAWAVTRLTRAWIRSFRRENPAEIFNFIPAVLLLVFHSQYTHPLAVTLALAFSLLFFFIQTKVDKTILMGAASFLFLACVLYHVAAGALLLFALLCALHEIFVRKRPALGVVCLLAVAAIPAVSKQFLFALSTEQAYLQLSLFQKTTTRPVLAAGLLYGFFLLYFVAGWLFSMRHSAFLKKPLLKKAWLQFALQTLVLFALAAAAALLSYKKGSHTLLRVEYQARHERWKELLKFSARERSDLLPVAFQTNRALFHSGRLLEDMFSYPQNHGVAGLILPRAYRYSAPLQESDFCWDLGSINESRHWAYEAFSVDGETPWILKRMVTVDIVGGDFRAASRCLNLLDRTLFFRDWAKKYREYLSNPALAAADPVVEHGRSMLVKTDFIVVNDHPMAELDSLLKINPDNRMAFEYRVAHILLSRKLGGLHTRLAMLNRFGYQSIPRHMAEALLGLWALSGKRDKPDFFRFIRPETLQRFRDFNLVLASHQGDRAAAEAEYRLRFGDTYWYYMFYGNTAGRSGAQASNAGGIE